MRFVLFTALLLSFFSLQLKSEENSTFVKNMNKFYGDQESRAVWLSFPWWDLSLSKKRVLADYLSQKNVNTIYLAVYGSGVARWPSVALKESGLATVKTEAEFAETVNLLRESGIRVVPWFEGGFSAYLKTDFPKNHPELLQKCGNGTNSGEYGGKVMAFLDVSQPAALKPMVDSMIELATHSLGFDEIQIDRIRYTRSSSQTICKAKDGSSDPKHINNAVKAMYEAVKSIDSSIIVSASPVGSVGQMWFNQKWEDWAAGGYIDAVTSQAYIKPTKLNACRRGSKKGIARTVTLGMFQYEVGQQFGRLKKLQKRRPGMKILGGGIKDLDLGRVDSQKSSHFAFSLGYRAQDFDDSECVLEQMKHARGRGVANGSLWISQVAPSSDGSPNQTIDDNLSLLSETIWVD